MRSNIATLVLLFSISLYAESYKFIETRYSNAIDQSITLQGNITFTVNGLSIQYPNKSKILTYTDGYLEYTENQKIKELDNNISQRITQYFEILILLHNYDEDILSKSFVIETTNELSMLTPIGNLSNYIKYIELTRSNQDLKEIKLYLQNKDIITISIGNEVR